MTPKSWTQAFGFKCWDKSRNLLLTKPEKFQLTGRLLKFAIFPWIQFVLFKTWLFPMSHTYSQPFLEVVHTFLPRASFYLPIWIEFKCVYVESHWHHSVFNKYIPTSPSSGQGNSSHPSSRIKTFGGCYIHIHTHTHTHARAHAHTHTHTNLGHTDQKAPKAKSAPRVPAHTLQFLITVLTKCRVWQHSCQRPT